ncbi:MAG: hypothetical protein ABEI98_11690 [Halorhabdus sp.]
MATTGAVELDTETGAITVEELTIRDADLVDYLAAHDPEEQRELAAQAFRIGLTTLRLAETSKDLEHVKQEFDNMHSAIKSDVEAMQSDLEERFGDEGDVPTLLDDYLGEDGEVQALLDDALGDDGQLADRLDAELGEDGERIQTALDPDREGTPTNRLRAQLMERIDGLRDKIAEEAGVAQERQQSPQKGHDFEETVAGLLDDAVYGTNDTVRHTGDERGALDDKKGDHVVTLGETGQRIVIESKSEDDYYQPRIKEQLDQALENRDADIAVFVSECESYVPDKVGYFKEFDKQRLAVCLSEDEDDDLDAGFLQIALNWARMRAVEKYVDTGAELDTEVIQARVESARDRVEQVSSLKKKCRSITDTAQAIRSELDELRDDVTEDLNQIIAELSKERNG